MANERLRLDGHKLLYHLDRLMAWQGGERIAPIHIDMGLTKDCNLRCRYCYGKIQRLDRSVIPRDPLLRFMADAGAVGVRSVGFIGDGEPLLNPAVYDAVAAGRRAGVEVALATNGILLDEALIPRLLEQLTYLRFNLSAADPAAFARIHQGAPDLFATALAKIRACVAEKRRRALPVTLGLQMVLIPDDLDQVMPLVRLGSELGVDYLVIKHCSDSEDHQLGVPLADYPNWEPLLRAAEAGTRPGYQVIVKWRKIMQVGRKAYDRCLGIPFLLQISGNGDVKPCGFLFPKPGYLMGNIVTQSFREILASDRYWETIRQLATEFDVHTQCGTACRQDYINEFLWELVHHPPAHRNFI